jgi:hypothetical protein
MLRYLAPCAINYIFERLTTYSYCANYAFIKDKVDELDFLYVMTGSVQVSVENGTKPIRFALVRSQHIC